MDFPRLLGQFYGGEQRDKVVKSGRALQFERLAFFSDAVFAIAITLLVIEVKPPHGDFTSEAALGDALIDLIPNYIGFFISFFVIGRFWSGHHRYLGYLKDWDSGLVRVNLLFLMTIAFLPFPTALIGSNAGARTAIIFYCGWLMIAGAANLLLIGYIQRHPHLLAAPLSPHDRHDLRSAWLPIAIGSISIAAAQFGPRYGLIVLVVSPLVFGTLLAVIGRKHAPTSGG